MNNRCSHRVENVTATAANVILTVSESTNISPFERFDFYFPQCEGIGNIVTGEPLPVLISVNGANITVLDKNGLPLDSDKVPRRSQGRYIVPDAGTPYVILYNTPYDRCDNYYIYR